MPFTLLQIIRIELIFLNLFSEGGVQLGPLGTAATDWPIRIEFIIFRTVPYSLNN
jgi:hypothetical protein